MFLNSPLTNGSSSKVLGYVYFIPFFFFFFGKRCKWLCTTVNFITSLVWSRSPSVGKVWGNSWDGDRNPNNLCPLSLPPLTLTLSSLSNSEDWPAELRTPASGSLSSPKAAASPGHRADFSPTQLPPGQMQFFLIDLPPGHGRTSKGKGWWDQGPHFLPTRGKVSLLFVHTKPSFWPQGTGLAPHLPSSAFQAWNSSTQGFSFCLLVCFLEDLEF